MGCYSVVWEVCVIYKVSCLRLLTSVCIYVSKVVCALGDYQVRLLSYFVQQAAGVPHLGEGTLLLGL